MPQSARPPKSLDDVLAEVNARFGKDTLHKLGPAPTVPHLPTGFPILDKALGIGGVPRGSVTETVTAPTSGMGTLALSCVANAQAQGDMAVYMDLSHSFDPDYAVRCGVDVNSLLVVRPEPLGEALEMAYRFVQDGSVGVLVYDMSLLEGADRQSALNLSRVLGALAKSPCAFVLLSSPAPAGDLSYTALTTSPHVALRLQLDRVRWLKRRAGSVRSRSVTEKRSDAIARDVQGYRAKVIISKNKFAPLAAPVTITIGLSGTIRGEGA